MPNGCSSKPWPQHERARAGILGAASKSLYPYLHMTSPASPIGVFDSGIGGLSVLQALRHELPHERFVYLADSGNAPYGDARGDAFVQQRTRTIARHLREQHQIKVLVIACNTATAAAVDMLRAEMPELPLIGVEPAIKPASLSSQTDRKSTRLNSSHLVISYAVFCLKKKKK